MEIYVIKDNSANTCGTPFFSQQHVQAMRIFKTEVNRQADNNMLYLYPAEWDLYYIGSFDPKTAKITPVEPEKIANGNQVKNI